MPPVDFNPSSKSIDLQNNKLDKQKSGSLNAQTPENAPAGAAEADTDKFVRSDLLAQLQNSVKLAEFEAVQREKVESLKTQVQQRTLPILAEDAEERLQSARAIANNLIELDRQLGVLNKE